jgi:hypothetical protein
LKRVSKDNWDEYITRKITSKHIPLQNSMLYLLYAMKTKNRLNFTHNEEKKKETKNHEENLRNYDSKAILYK